MKTRLLKEVREIAEYLGCNEEELVNEITKILDAFGVCAIDCVGGDEAEKIKGLFGEMVAVPENKIRNEFRKYLREKLGQELFK
jgi:hypothetical protein